MQNKDLVFICSPGRTGTTFLGQFLEDALPEASSFHEPDVIYLPITKKTIATLAQFGLYRTVIGRLLGKTGIRNLTKQYLSSQIDKHQASRRIREERDHFYNSFASPLIIESYSQWFGMIDVLPQAYPGCKVAGIIRDPRSWATSCLNMKDSLYFTNNWLRTLLHGSIQPKHTNDSEYAARWKNMSLLEKRLWVWRTVAKSLLQQIENPDFRLYRFEELFSKDSRHMESLLEFITRFPDKHYSYDISRINLSDKWNQSVENNIATWQNWTAEECHTTMKICEPYMSQLGYGMEKEWHQKIS